MLMGGNPPAVPAEVMAAIPKPADAPPPPVGNTNACGSSTEFARADHTHVSSVWAGTAATDANGDATFVFPAGFFEATPVISADIQNANVNIIYNRAITTQNKDRVVVRVRAAVLVTGLLSIPAAGLLVNLIARRASA